MTADVQHVRAEDFDLGIIPMTHWGKDHWSMLAYIALRAIDHGGKLDDKHIRYDVAYATLLRNGVPCYGHTDEDVMADIEHAGLIEGLDDANDEESYAFRMTWGGWALVTQLWKHKAAGGCYGDFEFDEAMIAETGVNLIAKERGRQVAKWPAAHDDGELAIVAAILATAGTTHHVKRQPGGTRIDVSWYARYIGQSKKDRLIAAGALIAAEIDRLTRAELATEAAKEGAR